MIVKLTQTRKQAEKLSPLFDLAAEKPHSGVVLGQFYENGYTPVSFFAAPELLKYSIKLCWLYYFGKPPYKHGVAADKAVNTDA